MNTIHFVAYRRGRKVIIKGKVPVSSIARGPYLKWIPEPNTSVRAFQLCYRETIQSTSPYAETMVLIVHEEPDVPEYVRSLRIDLPGDKRFWIQSERPWKE